MNSGTQQDAALEKQETSAMSKFQAVELTLTLDQYTVIQHFLPKGYTLQERKSTKREKGSSHKLIDAEVCFFTYYRCRDFLVVLKILKKFKEGRREPEQKK
jgi:hypothetical protein